MGVDADKASHSSSFSRREFLKMAGVGAAKAVISDLGIPDPPEPKLKSREALTEGDKIKLALSVRDRLKFVDRRSVAGLGIKIDIPEWPDIVDGEPVENERWKRKFPNFPLQGVRESLNDTREGAWFSPTQLSVFSYPQLNSWYITPFDSYPLKSGSNGDLVIDGQIGDVYRRNLATLPEDALELIGGVGFIGELWKLKTTEFHRAGLLEIEWLAGRGIPYIDKEYRSDSAVDRMANVFSGSPQLAYKDSSGKLFGISAYEDVLFVPVGLKVTSNTPPNKSPEFIA